MNTLDFLKRVLPEEGLYCVAVFQQGNDAPQHGYFDTVDKLAKVVKGLEAKGQNTYYAISTFKEKRRLKANVHLTKVVALDVDCGMGKNGEPKPYPNQVEGGRALGQFIKDTGLPMPMIVSSGNGLHVYWILSEAVTPEKWNPLAQALKSACVKFNFTSDIKVTGDSARILRPTECTNPWGGKVAKLLRDAPDVAYDQLWQLLSPHTSGSQYEPPAVRSSGSKLLDAMTIKHEYAPSKPEKIVESCAQIKWAAENPAKVSEPMWYMILGVASACENPEQTAIDWSKGHAGFDQNKTLQKLDQWRQKTTGPALCDKFKEERPEGCKGCKFNGKIASPARLGSQLAEVTSKAIEVDPVAAEIEIPKPFKRTTAGIKMVIDETDVDICRFDIYPVGYGRDENLGYEVVRFMWERQHVGWTELSLRQAYLTEGNNEFANVIADQGIVLFNKTQTMGFQMMLRSYMEALKQKRGLTNLYSSMGWKNSYNEFVIGNTMLRRQPDGTITQETINLSSAINKIGDSLYSSKGSLDEWVRFTQVLEKANLPVHKFLLGLSFATPLLKLSGLKGLTISMHGESGSGKTIAQILQQSVWGNPDQLHFGGKFTMNSLFSRLSLHGNLPMTVDEVTIMNKDDAGEFLYWVSQGRDKARLSRNSEERATKEWQTTTTLSTNTSLQSMLYANGTATDAQLARLIEFEMVQNPLFSKDSQVGRKMYRFLNANYGWAGIEFMKHIMSLGEEGTRAMIDHSMATFNARYNVKFTGVERYWEAGIVLSDLGNQIAKELGLIMYDYEDATRNVLQRVGVMKSEASANKTNAFEILGEYVNENLSSLLVVTHTDGQKPMRDNSRPYINDVSIRYDLYRKSFTEAPETGTAMIERTKFRKWLSRRGHDFGKFSDEMLAAGAIATPKSGKSYLGKDVGLKIPQCYVIGINLSVPQLRGILDDAHQPIENQTLGQLQAV